MFAQVSRPECLSTQPLKGRDVLLTVPVEGTSVVVGRQIPLARVCSALAVTFNRVLLADLSPIDPGFLT